VASLSVSAAAMAAAFARRSQRRQRKRRPRDRLRHMWPQRRQIRHAGTGASAIVTGEVSQRCAIPVSSHAALVPHRIPLIRAAEQAN
jgi:hypothetical protein